MINIVWLGIVAFSMILEFFTRTFFTLWFGLGAIVAFVLSLLGVPLPVQIVTFLVISLVLLGVFRQYAVKSYKYKTNIHELIGQEAIICGENANGSLLRLNGIEWTAETEDGKALNIGDRVLVRGIRGIKLLVKTKS
ncbi:Nucleic acid-binding, OB-fold [Acididesulfobacillus acetoxydans]|uniref:NfeD-like C-terminal, partner-binding n=1 Tax=Acididesulfobacillus acetoxydans TaxID=1561005 RepID=A0A8S0W6Z7_9FIRM|nr:NfeD family protein [Acididesulfobacillus acetoxydans]CAA7600269.1 Nucleic acid-binding, OB-fold [Acididesulfobacillus acetoxydans]CEJ09647.1 NfeD-like C-terminal, partner-binding [Acididesulfobacillus acetoxydans]